jgi:hypothetical protein
MKVPATSLPATGAHLAPSVDEIIRLRRVASGREQPDVVLRGAKS